MESLFWVSAAIVLYVYAGYPLILAAWARLAGAPPRRQPAGAPRRWPSISIVVAARNEAARLPSRVANLLTLPYPGPREIIIVSDGSTDQTRSALAPFDGRVRLIELAAGGKPRALNAGVAASTGDILVFADARQRFDDRALVELVAAFDDERVGGVTGALILDCERANASEGAATLRHAQGRPERGRGTASLRHGRQPRGETSSSIGEGVGLYWRYEKWLRRNESLVRSTLGATGAIYALRRSLWRPLPADTLLDDVLAPMRAVLAGARIVFEEQARAYDRAAPDAAAESRRKTRTLAGNYQLLLLEPRLLLPWANPVWLQFMSHKVGRLVVPWALVAMLASSAALAPASWLYATALVLQLGFYGLAAVGGWLVKTEPVQRARVLGKETRVAYTFVMMNYAAVAGLLALRRVREVWR